jgi:hypothetical protein
MDIGVAAAISVHPDVRAAAILAGIVPFALTCGVGRVDPRQRRPARPA